MNPASLEKTLPGKREVARATLRGYQRKMNAPVNGYLYLNIVPDSEKSIDGVMIAIDDEDFARLKRREIGYEAVDVSDKVSYAPGTVYAFVAPDKHHPGLPILQTYIETCSRHLSEGERETWLAETIIQNPILDDRTHPAYANAA